MSAAWGVLTERHVFVVFLDGRTHLTILGDTDMDLDDYNGAADLIALAGDLESTGRAAKDVLRQSV